ncbi:Deoxyhypusine synthase, partial [mine drainage metagenome]
MRGNPKRAILKKSIEIGSGRIRGYDFDKKFDAKDFFESYNDTGLQATNLGTAISLVKKMRNDNAYIFLGFTSNVTTSGLRDIITYLVRNKLVNFIVTTTGGVEEDIIKTHGNFLHGSFYASGEMLRKKGVNRTGNIFIPNERYIWFEDFMKCLLSRLYKEQIKTGNIIDSRNFIREMGQEMEREKRKDE